MYFALTLVFTLLGVIAFLMARRKAEAMLSRSPFHDALWTFFCTALPAFSLLCLWSIIKALAIELLVPADIADPRSIEQAASDNPSSAFAMMEPFQGWPFQGWSQIGQILIMALSAFIGFRWAWQQIGSSSRAREHLSSLLHYSLFASSCLTVLVTIGIFFSLFIEATHFFMLVPVDDFLFGLVWSPQVSLRPDQIGASGAFGAVPVFLGTLLITAIAMIVAMPLGLLAAIYTAEYASARQRNIIKPAMEILAGIPTVVYGVIAALAVAPALRNLGNELGLDIASESALAAGVVMGFMILPFVSSLSDDALKAVPQSLREGALALGSTQAECIARIVLPTALPGILGGLLLAISRALGETMIVVMAAGLAARLPEGFLETLTMPFQAHSTVTVQIVSLLTGDSAFDSPKTLAAFALGLSLFILTFSMNFLASMIIGRYRRRYASV